MNKRPKSRFKKLFKNMNILLVMKLHQITAPKIGESTRMGRTFQIAWHSLLTTLVKLQAYVNLADHQLVTELLQNVLDKIQSHSE
jgi:hypothetical protein